MFRSGTKLLAQCLLWLAPLWCVAQGSPSLPTSVEILVRVTFPNDRSAGDQIRVQLVSETGVPVGDAFTDSEGRAAFRVQSTGNYTVRASGMHLKGTASERVLVSEMDKSRTVYVRATPMVDSTVSSVQSNAPPVTSAAELRVPADARKTFRKGMDAWARSDFYKAAEQFEKAVALYPQYDAAYNNLGVMYLQTGQAEKARAAFEKSVTLNDKNADADRNLARILIRDGNYARAQELLKKSLMVEPLNPASLTLLCVAQMNLGNENDALATARKVHQLPHEGYAVVHEIAGQVYEHKGDRQSAAIEYETYLRETPNGPEAGEVKTSLARLTASRQPSPQ